jgi:signal peptidase I
MREVLEILSWLALPVGIICAFDSWFLHPKRVLAARNANTADPPFINALYYALPVLCVAVILRLLSAETLDFSLVLVIVSAVTGVIWGLDVLFFRKSREQAAAATAGAEAVKLAEPGTVDYARSFFPVAIVVLVLRAFVFEPFRIPSDSMMPTLLAGDFIVVNKYAYGLRWPVVNRKFVEVSTPQRGDVIVFRLPVDTRVNYIKRLVGLPGDKVEVRNDRLVVNGEAVPYEEGERYNDGCYTNMRLATEQLGTHKHRVLSCRSPLGLAGSRLPGCDRDLEEHWQCDESRAELAADSGDRELEVPAGHYLMIGDNRDNSQDSRYWGFVPEANLVGKATRIWFNFDTGRTRWFNWGRVGQRIE